MSRLQDELQKRAGAPTPYEQAQQKIIARFEERTKAFLSLLKNKDFKEYLKLEEEMNDPMIVVAHDCSDSVCMAMKRKIRDFRKRQQVLEKVGANGTTRPGPQSHSGR